MYPHVDTRSTAAVEAEVTTRWHAMFGPDEGFVRRGFALFHDSFDGLRLGREPLDLPYHDREHTLQGTLCLARLLQGWRGAPDVPAPDEPTARLALLAILLHDTGYLKPAGDRAGTGAKYMPNHEARSVAFVEGLGARAGLTPEDAAAVGRMIWCTSLGLKPDKLGFRTETERLAGCAVGTADLLGQMAAEDYPERLDGLFAEFEESIRHNGWSAGGAPFASVEELRRSTPAFWEQVIWPRLQGPLLRCHRFLNDPQPDGPNEYLDRIHANLARLDAVPA